MRGALISEITTASDQPVSFIVDKICDVSSYRSLMDIKNLLGYAYAVMVNEDVNVGMTFVDGIIYDNGNQIYPPPSAEAEIKRLNDIIAELTYNVDESSLNLDALKDYLIKKNKKNLEDYFYDSPICVDGKFYTITSEKQNQATGIIQAYVLAQQFGCVDMMPPLTWNETSGVCSPITLQELFMIYLQMLAAVKPVVSYQQHTESKIRNAKTREEVLSIDVSFDNYNKELISDETNETSETTETNETSETTETNETSETGEINETDETAETNE